MSKGTATALYTACRKGELLGLTWNNVHMDGDIRRIEIRSSYATGSTKSGAARTVPVHPELAPLLRAWRERCSQTPEALVFPVVKGKGSAVRYRMGTGLDMLGIKDVLAAANIKPPDDSWHACRHTLATHMTEACGNDHAVAMMLGHASKASAAVTRGYTHASVKYIYQALCLMTLRPPVAAGVADLTERRRLLAVE